MCIFFDTFNLSYLMKIHVRLFFFFRCKLDFATTFWSLKLKASYILVIFCLLTSKGPICCLEFSFQCIYHKSVRHTESFHWKQRKRNLRLDHLRHVCKSSLKRSTRPSPLLRGNFPPRTVPKYRLQGVLASNVGKRRETSKLANLVNNV